MNEPRWLTRVLVDAMHRDLLRMDGGLWGVKDENALESALARPRNRFAYEPDVDVFALAAAYGYGLARNHGYADGNKRIAFMAMYTFLGLNGQELTVDEPVAVLTTLELASGVLDEAELAEWLRENCEPI